MSSEAISSSPALGIVTESLAYGDVIHVFGDIDILSAPELESTIVECTHIGTRVFVNLLECRYLDSSGISVLVRAHKTLGGRLRVIAAEGSHVDRVLRVTGVHRLFALANSLTEALS